MKSDELTAFLDAAYGSEPWPKPFHVLQGRARVLSGEDVGAVARSIRTTRARLEEVATQPEPAFFLLGVRPAELSAEDIARARSMLAQLLIGRAAELAFEDIYREEIGDDKEFRLVDLREGRTDTDYRLLNGQDRPLYRVNIKFFGSIFRRAPELVSIDPEDCFPLATYKIYGALQKQQQEHLPYIFTIVGVPNLTAASIGHLIDDKIVQIVALMMKSTVVERKRDVQDRIVETIVTERSLSFVEVYEKIRAAEWYVLSARKADMLLRDLLFDRVYALRIRSFAQQFRGAELDMHFSLKNDLATLREFLDVLRDEGQTKVASLLERGTF